MSALHDFDLQLCSYVHYNVSRHFEDAGFAKAVTSALPPELAAYLRENTRSESGDFRPMLLNYDELMKLHSVIDFTSLKHGRHWTAFTDIHSLSTQCTGEIHRRLARAEAEKWAEASRLFSEILEHHPLTLADGIWNVNEWIGELEWYLRAMGEEQLLPIPDGEFLTPTNPSRSTSTRPRAIGVEPTSAGPDSSPSFQAKPGSLDAKLTPPQLARRLGVGPEKIHVWIRSGELRAVNIATNPKGRPRYVIDPADVEAFEARRSINKTPSTSRRRKRASDDVIEFF